MDEEQSKQIAALLRKPTGEYGHQVAEMMNKGNYLINMNTIQMMPKEGINSILEIGMGNGFFVKDMLEINDSIHYTGCDYSNEMVHASEELNRAFVDAGRAFFVHGTADELPFEDEGFDLILTINTLYFWDDREKILRECQRCLKQDGQLIIAIRPKRVMKNYPFAPYGFTMYDKEDLIQWLESQNCQIIDVQEFDEGEGDRDGKLLPIESLIVKLRFL